MAFRVAVIGTGYMGSAHARVISRIAEEYPGLVELGYVVDVVEERARRVAARYGGEPLRSVEELEEVDLAIVATPTSTHRKVFESLLGRVEGGVLVEKPVALSVEEAAEMIEAAESHGIQLFAGHIERYNPAVRILHQRLERGLLGKVLTIVAKRVGPFTPRVKDTDVVFDLAVHEIDNVLAISGSLPSTVRAYALSGLVSGLDDYALIVLGYSRGFAGIEVNRVTPFKQRELFITTDKAVVKLNYMEQVLRVYREDEETNILVKREEPLYLEDLSIVQALLGEDRAVVDGYQAFLATLLCELARESQRRGRDVYVEETSYYDTYRDLVEKGLRSLGDYSVRLLKG